MKYDWTESSLVIIFSALFALSAFSEPEETKPSNDENGVARTEKVKDESNELEMIKAEFSVFRHQLSEVLLKSEKQNKELLRIENKFPICHIMNHLIDSSHRQARVHCHWIQCTSALHGVTIIRVYMTEVTIVIPTHAQGRFTTVIQIGYLRAIPSVKGSVFVGELS